MKIILSGFRANNDLLTNIQQNDKLKQEAAKLGLDWLFDGVGSFQEAGQDKPSQEVCMAFVGTTANCRELAWLAMLTYNQDAVLFIDEDNADTYLVERSGAYLHHTGLGKFTKVSQNQAKALPVYTYVNGEYFVCI